jgi:GTP-binding protein EngB required for normal cell division
MNITDYLHAKFELAEILRAAAVTVRAREPAILYPFEDLFARLAEDRFNIAVVGQFSRGKTSLMNAMLNTESLPMGVVPVTSVITTIQYGTEERAVIEYVERRLPNRIGLNELPQFVTQRDNPGNEKGIRFACVELPAEILRQGFYLIDTPGLGSAVLENTRTTEEFLPQADAFVIVTGYDSPLSGDELRLLQALGDNASRCFVVVNKMDLVNDTERQAVEEHMRQELRSERGSDELEFFAVSARDAMAANKANDAEMLKRSGVPAFIDRLIRFVVEEKHTVFLQRMADRIDTELGAMNFTNERNRIRQFMAQIAPTVTSSATIFLPRHARPRFAQCAVCAPVERDVLRFLQSFQYRIVIDEHVRQALRAGGGLCPFHTWQYAALASPHGTCVAYPAIFDPIIEGVRSLRQSRAGTPGEILHQLQDNLNCTLCRVCHEATERAVADVVDATLRALSGPSPGLPDVCLPHLRLVVVKLGDEAGSALLDATVESWQRTADDMRRYALKRDGSRRAFTTADELDADIRGLRALAGHASLSFVRRVQR